MIITRLKLVNYRNYKSLDIDFSKSTNIIYGNNAQGKTNIVESIYLCASGRSHRTSKDFELLKNSEDSFYIKLNLNKLGSEGQIEITYSPEERKKIKINELPIKKLADLMGHLNAVMFSPEDLQIIKQGPSERRRFVDITLSQLRPSYFHDLQQYAKILYQRNTLLKSIPEKKELEGTLEVWDSHLAQTGSRIMKSRFEFIKRLNCFAKNRHELLTGGKEELLLKYEPSFEYDFSLSEKELADEILKRLNRNRRMEILKGISLTGPHRDDINILLNCESTKVYGSQGQQRTAVLSMKLAEIDLMKEESGDCPVLLLDDVLSELDDDRKKQLLDCIEGMQTFITCTDRGLFDRTLEDTRFYKVENGNVTEETINLHK